MKKFFASLCCTLLLVGSIGFLPSQTAFAASNDSKISTSSTSVNPKPMISNWVFQNDTPIVGRSTQYNTDMGSTSKNLKLQNSVLKVGLSGLTTALNAYLPATVLAKSIAQMVFTTVSINAQLDTPTFYVVEHKWGMDGSAGINYEIIQNWYSDSAHTKYVCTTYYYASFM